MSEFSEHQIVDAPGDLDEPGAANSVIARSGPDPHVNQPPAEVHALVDTWGSHLPALRLTAVSASDDDPVRDEAGRAAAPPSAPAYNPAAAPPHWLRPLRYLAGILLLAIAWVAAVAVFVLVRLLLGGFAQEPSLPVRLGLVVLTALGVAWLAIVALACVVAAAFSLGLAITSRGW